mgnify:CR=1 FL=1
MQAVVLVGGLGTRLHPLTADTPKQMLPIVDRPMIEHVVAHLGGHGVTRVVLSLGFRPEAFIDAYPDGTCAGIPIHYAVEPEPLDTAGAVRFAAVDAGIVETFLVLNGDVLTVTGERRQEKTDRHLSEFGYGRFERRFTLPDSVVADQVSASFEHGMLELTLPVTEAAKPRRIEIGGEASKAA